MSSDFFLEIRRAWRVARLEPKAIQEVAHNRHLTLSALGFIAASSLAGAFGAVLFPVEVGPVVYRPTVFEALVHGVLAFLWMLLLILFLQGIAQRFFGGAGSYWGLVRMMGYGYAVGILNLIPWLSPFVLIWMMVLSLRALHHGKGLTPNQAGLTLLAVIVIFAVMALLFQNINPANLYGGIVVDLG